MKKKNATILVTLAVALVSLIGYVIWPEKKFALPEHAVELDLTKTDNEKSFLNEEDYTQQMEVVAMPYLESRKVTGYFSGYDQNQIYYEQYKADNERAHIVVVHGYTDASYKFREMAYYFLQNGYSVSILDHRGHGYSYRELEEKSKVTINDFDEYFDDLQIFVTDIVRPTMSEGEQLFAYAHSMGGGITALSLERNPDLFDAAVLSSPMMEIEYGVPNHSAEMLTAFANAFGMKHRYIIGGSDFSDEYAYELSTVGSRARYDYLYQFPVKDEHYQTSGGTYAWLKAAIEATVEIRKNAAVYKTPTLLFQASADDICGPNGQNEFASKAENVQLITVAGCKHSILFSENEVLIPYVNTILEFFENQVLMH